MNPEDPNVKRKAVGQGVILGMLWLFASRTISLFVLPTWADLLGQMVCMILFVQALNYLGRNKPPPDG